MIPYFSVLAGPGGGDAGAIGGTGTSVSSWLGDIPIIGPLLEFLAESAVALTEGLAALGDATTVVIDSVGWLPASIGALVFAALSAIAVMKLFGR